MFYKLKRWWVSFWENRDIVKMSRFSIRCRKTRGAIPVLLLTKDKVYKAYFLTIACYNINEIAALTYYLQNYNQKRFNYKPRNGDLLIIEKFRYNIFDDRKWRKLTQLEIEYILR